MKINFSKKFNQNIIMGLIILCLIGLGLGEVLKNKEEAMGYFGIYKQNREEDIRNMASTIKYATDKICKINYYSEKIECSVCIEYYIQDEKRYECVDLPEDSTMKEDDEIIKEFVRNDIEENYPIEYVDYIEKSTKGRDIKIGTGVSTTLQETTTTLEQDRTIPETTNTISESTTILKQKIEELEARLAVLEETLQQINGSVVINLG